MNSNKHLLIPRWHQDAKGDFHFLDLTSANRMCLPLLQQVGIWAAGYLPKENVVRTKIQYMCTSYSFTLSTSKSEEQLTSTKCQPKVG